MIGKVFKFCPLCGNDLVEKHMDGRTRLICGSCEFIHYQNPVPAAGVIVVDEGRVLLVKRKFNPRVGMWTLPAGFVEADEDAAGWAVREMKEETNLDVELEEWHAHLSNAAKNITPLPEGQEPHEPRSLPTPQ